MCSMVVAIQIKLVIKFAGHHCLGLNNLEVINMYGEEFSILQSETRRYKRKFFSFCKLHTTHREKRRQLMLRWNPTGPHRPENGAFFRKSHSFFPVHLGDTQVERMFSEEFVGGLRKHSKRSHINKNHKL